MAATFPAVAVADDRGQGDFATNMALYRAERSRIDSIINSVALAPGPVRKDLIARGLIIEEKDVSGETVGGSIWFNRIGDLIGDGTYHINLEGALRFGPAPQSNTLIDRVDIETAWYYKWAQMRTTYS